VYVELFLKRLMEMVVEKMKGVVVLLKDKNVFKQENKISSNPIYPMYLKKMEIVERNRMGVVGCRRK